MIPTLQTYRNQLHPWCVVRVFPGAQLAIVARCRKRNDAEAHRRVLQQLVPQARYLVVFEALPPDSESID